MDKNNLNETGGQLPQENPFKNWVFYVSFFATLLVLGVIVLLSAKDSAGYWTLVLFLICSPCAIAGLIVWAIVRKRSRAVALGILLGSLVPFVVVFVMTGGCILGLA